MREFAGKFERIDFAILDNPSLESNYEIFKRILYPKGKERAVEYNSYTPPTTPLRTSRIQRPTRDTPASATGNSYADIVGKS